jgi:hypothetical protein
VRRARLALRALLLAAPFLVLAYANAASLRAHWTLDDIGPSRRYWEDLTVAFSRFETRGWGKTQVVPISDAMAIRVNRRLHEIVPRAVERDGVRPWEFWRVTPIRSFQNMAPFELRFSDDTGRAFLSGLGFKWLGGIAPYLPIWLPFLFLAPLCAWIMLEFLRAGEGPAGGVFLLLLSSSAYLLQTLTLPYSAAGFHLLAALTIIPLALFAFGPAPDRRGLAWRVLAASAALNVDTLCRSSGSLFLLLAALLLLLALARAEAASPLKVRVLLSAGLLLVLFLPRAAAPKQAHEVWIGVWEGLGDFDRERGHVWSDFVARTALDREGYSMATRGPYWNPETEAIFRRLVLEDIAKDPVWYAKILAQRVVSAVTQWRLMPRATQDGATYLAAQHPGEGVVETYYNFVSTADLFTFLGRRFEAPLWLFWACGAGLTVSSLVRRGRGSAGWTRFLTFLAFLASAMAMPVAITTLSGIEMQTVILGYLLAGAFLLADLGVLLKGALLVTLRPRPASSRP